MPGGSVVSVGVRFSRPWLRRGEAPRRSRHLQAAWRARYVTAKAACLRQFSKPVFLHENHIVVPFGLLGRPLNTAEFYIAWFDPNSFQRLYIMSTFA